MKFSTILSVLSLYFASTSALAIDLPVFRQSDKQSPLNLAGPDFPEVPGNSPVKLCSTNPKEDTVTIDRVDLEPNPPQPGKALLIKASGTVKERIEDGAYVAVVVKIGLIVLMKKQFDFCSQVVNQVDLSCPVEKGPVNITKEVELPKEIPKAAKITVTAHLFTIDDDPITCLTADVKFM